MVDVPEIKQKIINLIKIRGPSVPVQISGGVGTNTILASALLSELFADGAIKISNMKVGSSPLYFLPGQEAMLEKFYNYLPGKEIEAFSVLKEKGVLEDAKLEPSIRVALRNIKDFSFPILVNWENQKVLFWKYLTLLDSEMEKRIEAILESRKGVAKPTIKIEEKPIEIKQNIKPTIKVEEKPKVESEKQKPLIEIKKKREKQKDTMFLERIKAFLELKDIEFLQEIETDKKEVIAKIRINSDLGKMIFLLIAKDKKKITEADLIKAYQKAINEKMPCYFLFRGETSKKMQENIESYKNILKIDKIN